MDKELQGRLAELGFYKGAIDGIIGKKTIAAIKAFQKENDLTVDGVAGPKTTAIMFPPKKVKPKPEPIPEPDAHINPEFDAGSAKRLRQAHPLLQLLMNEAREVYPFMVLDSQRGREAQEAAFRKGNSKAHFGDSAHNWNPAIAVDVAPIPLDWSDHERWRDLQKIIGWYTEEGGGRGTGLAAKHRIPIRWGGDWNMDGRRNEKLVDLPHYELHPWREWAKQSKLYKG